MTSPAESFRFPQGGNLEPGCSDIEIVPSAQLDSDPLLAPDDIKEACAVVTDQMAALGFNLNELTQKKTEAGREAAIETVDRVEVAAALLYSQWELARRSKDKTMELAIARLFNGMTGAARTLDKQFGLFNQDHVHELARYLHAEMMLDRESGGIDVQLIAEGMNHAAKQRTHELSWPWVMLPTFPSQHYGRILLQKVPFRDSNFPTFITQTTFIAKEGTQFHTHGQNWAFARPLGDQDNSHVNAIWEPNSAEKAFPLKQVEKTYYGNKDVVVIPPRAIHSIYGAVKPDAERLSLEELQQNQDYIPEYAAHIRFGENSCMHIYRPDWGLASELKDSPLVQNDDKFFMDNDMIVFDHNREQIWSGGGGAWVKRMMEFGPEGDHCGACYTENDPRQENLDPKVILDWYIHHQQPKALKFHFS